MDTKAQENKQDSTKNGQEKLQPCYELLKNYMYMMAETDTVEEMRHFAVRHNSNIFDLHIKIPHKSGIKPKKADRVLLDPQTTIFSVGITRRGGHSIDRLDGTAEQIAMQVEGVLVRKEQRRSMLQAEADAKAKESVKPGHRERSW